MSIICRDQLFDVETIGSVVPQIIGDATPTLKRVEFWSSPCILHVGPTLQVTNIAYHNDTRVQYVFSRDRSSKWTVQPEDTFMSSADGYMTISCCTDCCGDD
jgi:hypothetical protein